MVLSPETSASGLSGHWYHLSACLRFLGDSWRWTFGGSKQTFQTRETLETRGARRKKQWKAKFEIKEKYTKITTWNELMDGVPKSKQNYHKMTKDEDGSRWVKICMDARLLIGKMLLHSRWPPRDCEKLCRSFGGEAYARIATPKTFKFKYY